MRLHIFLFVFATISTNITVRAADFSSYRNTNQLAWDADFKAVMKGYFGSKKMDAIWPEGLLVEQLSEALGGPPDKLTPISQSIFIASACRTHSCDEKAAVIFQSP